MAAFIDVQSLALKASRSENFTVLPELARQVIKLSNNTATPAHELERLIQQDMALATKIIKVANSALYGGRNIDSIKRAIHMLGYNSIRSVAVTLAFQQATSYRPGATNFNLVEFWTHSLGTAVAAKSLASAALPELKEELYLGGMLHDMGVLILDRFEPALLTAVIQTAKENGLALYAVEQKAYGFTHADIGGLVAQKWEFSPLICNLISNHHDHSLVRTPEEFKKATALLIMADHVARVAGLVNQTNHVEPSEVVRQVAGVDKSAIDDAMGLVVQELVSVQHYFAGNAA